MALRRDIHQNLARDGILLGDPCLGMQLMQSEAGTYLLGGFVGASRPEEESQG
jgi:hypothetical protein